MKLSCYLCQGRTCTSRPDDLRGPASSAQISGGIDCSAMLPAYPGCMQLGSVLRSGRRGRGFKSRHPDICRSTGHDRIPELPGVCDVIRLESELGAVRRKREPRQRAARRQHTQPATAFTGPGVRAGGVPQLVVLPERLGQPLPRPSASARVGVEVPLDDDLRRRSPGSESMPGWRRGCARGGWARAVVPEPTVQPHSPPAARHAACRRAGQ